MQDANWRVQATYDLIFDGLPSLGQLSEPWRSFQVTTSVISDLSVDDIYEFGLNGDRSPSPDSYPDFSSALATAVRTSLEQALAQFDAAAGVLKSEGGALAVDYFSEALLGRTRVPVMGSPPHDWRTLGATAMPTGTSIAAFYFTDGNPVVVAASIGSHLLWLFVRSKVGHSIDAGFAGLVDDYFNDVRERKARARRRKRAD